MRTAARSHGQAVMALTFQRLEAALSRQAELAFDERLPPQATPRSTHVPRPSHSSQSFQALTTLLLALAISLAWPAMGGSLAHSGPPHTTGGSTSDAPHDHAENHPTADCSPDLGCCVMMHCHPGVAQSPLKISHAALFPKHEASAPADEAGVDPAIVLPPPRLLPG